MSKGKAKGPYDKRGDVTTTSVFEYGSANGQEWKSIIQDLYKDYSVSSKDSLKESIGMYFQGIDERINLSAGTYRNGKVVLIKPEDFRSFHAEVLIQQAANLLDRGLRARAEWDELSIRAFDLVLDLKEYVEMEQIHDEESKAGYYEWPAKEAKLLEEAELYSQQEAEEAEKGLTALVKYREGEKNKVLTHVKRAAHLSPFPVLFYDRPSQRHADIRGENSEGMVNDSLTTWQYETDGEVGEYHPHEVLEKAAEVQTKYAFEIQDLETRAHINSLILAKKAAKARKDAANVRADWEDKNKKFSLARTKLTIELQHMRAAAANTEGGALHYKERMDPLWNRFEHDFRQATTMMEVAAKGLREIYGYKEALPSDPFPPKENVTPRRFYDACIIWVRNALSFLASFSQKEQTYIQPISLRRILPVAQWEGGKQQGEWKLTITEQHLKETYAKDLFHVRLRGLNVFVMHKDANSVWQVILRAPMKGTSRHLPGQLENNKPVILDLDQSKVPICLIGRVMGRSSPRDPDLVGLSSQYNISPFGEWSVKVSQKDLLGNLSSEIEDIHLDLHLAFLSE
jgi:hypothetical protein